MAIIFVTSLRLEGVRIWMKGGRYWIELAIADWEPIESWRLLSMNYDEQFCGGQDRRGRAGPRTRSLGQVDIKLHSSCTICLCCPTRLRPWLMANPARAALWAVTTQHESFHVLQFLYLLFANKVA